METGIKKKKVKKSMLCRFSFLDIQCQFQPTGAAFPNSGMDCLRVWVNGCRSRDQGNKPSKSLSNFQKSSHLPKLRVRFVLDVWDGGGGGAAWPRWPVPRARARLRVSTGVTFRTETHFCFHNRKNTPTMRAAHTTQTLSPGRNLRPSFHFR